jgi:hypothetical protein
MKYQTNFNFNNDNLLSTYGKYKNSANVERRPARYHLSPKADCKADCNKDDR